MLAAISILFLLMLFMVSPTAELSPAARMERFELTQAAGRGCWPACKVMSPGCTVTRGTRTPTQVRGGELVGGTGPGRAAPERERGDEYRAGIFVSPTVMSLLSSVATRVSTEAHELASVAAGPVPQPAAAPIASESTVA